MGSKDNLSRKFRTRTVSQGANRVQTKSEISATPLESARCDTPGRPFSTFRGHITVRLVDDKMVQHLLHTGHASGKTADTRRRSIDIVRLKHAFETNTVRHSADNQR